MMEIGFFDEVRVARISDEDQLAEIEFAEAQEQFCHASRRWHDDTQQQHAMVKVSEAEVRLLNAFMRRSDEPIMLRAWTAYRRRLLYHHRNEG
jgi:hypothetical protein